MNWVGHIVRMLNVLYNNMIFCVHCWRWDRNITMVFTGVGLESVDWIVLAQDKAVVKTAIERRG